MSGAVDEADTRLSHAVDSADSTTTSRHPPTTHDRCEVLANVALTYITNAQSLFVARHAARVGTGGLTTDAYAEV